MNYVIMCVVFARSIAMEKKALITIKNNDSKTSYKVKVLLNDNTYRYREDTVNNTLVEFDSSNNVLKREDDNLSMDYLFINDKETIGKIYIKDLNKYIDVVIKTSKIEKNENKILIEYTILDDLYKYSIEME